MPQNIAQHERTFAIRVRFPNSANGTTGQVSTGSGQNRGGELTERSVADEVQGVEESICLSSLIAADVIDHPQRFGITEV